MGTNYYVKTDDGEVHIGKRSAAGWYCWDCRQTLCKGRVHYGDGYFDRCPICGKGLLKLEGLTETAVG